MPIQVHRPGKNLCGCRQCGCYDESPHSDQDISQMNWKMIRRENLRVAAEKMMLRDGIDPIMVHGAMRRRYIKSCEFEALG